MYIVVIYLILINIIAFILYGEDKKRARQGKWRISEKNLIGIAVIGGSIGAMLGMHLFRHKTKHWYFRFGLPAVLLLQAGLAWIIYLKL